MASVKKRKLSSEESRLYESKQLSQMGAMPKGCGISKLNKEHFSHLKSLNKTIMKNIGHTVPWGDGWNDNMQRCYCFLRETSWNVQKLCDAGVVIDTPDYPYGSTHTNDTNKHEYIINNCCLEMNLPSEQLQAIQHVIDETRKILQCEKDYLQHYEFQSVSLENLVAIQPNIHNDSRYLPLHLDDPRNDGFGIVIVTVALQGSADIILVDEGDDLAASESKHWSFHLKAGDMYVLSGPSRNLCSHGVLVSKNAKNRISLNFRFGLHSPEQAAADIDRHWK
jgi:hypothetical protein